VQFVLPENMPVQDEGIEFIFATSNLDAKTAKANTKTLLKTSAYKPSDYSVGDETESSQKHFGDTTPHSLGDAVRLYGQKAAEIAKACDFDVIHAHDWLSFLAGMKAKAVTDKPLVAHIHATAFDRSGGQGVNREVYDIEKRGLEAADAVLAVSNYTKQIVVENYGIRERKVTPVYNGIDSQSPEGLPPVLKHWKNQGGKVILFLGRQTIQKGPDYFLEAARVLDEIREDVLFVMAGSGDMQKSLIEEAAAAGLADKVLFPGFVRGDKVNRLYQSADLYVLPSVSEPFGITPLESLLNETPVLISQQSGVSEVVDHALKVDFWKTDRMAAKMDAVLTHDPLKNELAKNGHRQAKNLTWDKPAARCIECYNQLTQ
jgi:glycosyltransferase involved in cell wall biosynthesis